MIDTSVSLLVPVTDDSSHDDDAQAGALLPAPLLQAFYQGGEVVLNWTPIDGASGYTAELRGPGGQVVATTPTGASALTASFSAAQLSLRQGQTYSARVRAMAPQPGLWSVSQAVLVQDIAAPVPLPAYEGGAMLAGAGEIAGAQFYTFRISTTVDGSEDVVDEAFGTLADLPVTFPNAAFTPGQSYSVAAQAWSNNTLSTWSTPVTIVPQTLAAPMLTLTFAEPDVQASWEAAGDLTQYQFQLLTTAVPPQTISDVTLTAPPYAVNVAEGIVHGDAYVGQVRSQQGQSSSAWATADVTATLLDPLLAALLERLTAAHQNGVLPIDATALGAPGAAIVTMLSDTIGVSSITLADPITLTSDPLLDTVTAAGGINDTLLGIDSPDVTATFSVQAGAIVADIEVDAGLDWSLPTTFPALASTVVGDVTFNSDFAGSPAFVVSSLGAAATADRGALVSGLNFYGDLNVDGMVAPLLALLPGTPNPITVTGAVTSVDDGVFQLAAPVGSVAFAQLGGLAPIAFNAPSLALFSDAQMSGFPSTMQCLTADVAVGGLTLPLALRIPSGALGWAILLIPGRSVPVADLGTFFGFITGTPVAAGLPNAVAALANRFQVDNFALALTPDRSAFESLYVSVGSTPGAAEPLWSPLPGILDMTSLRVSVLVPGGAESMTGWIEGSVLLGDTLLLGAQIVLPIGAGKWTFSAMSDARLATLAPLNRLTGSSSFGSVLPAGLGELPDFTLKSLQMIVDPAAPSLDSVAVSAATGSSWHIVGDAVVLTDLAIDLDLANPTQASRTLTGTIDGSLVLGSVTLNANLTKVAADGDWTLAVTADPVVLPSLGDLADFVGGDGAAMLLPDSLRSLSFLLQDVAVDANLSTRSLQHIGFGLAATAPWPIFSGLLTLDELTTYLDLDFTTTPRTVTGGMLGTFLVGGASFPVSATYEQNIWTIEASMAPPASDGSGALDFREALTQFGIAGEAILPAGLGLPELKLTSGSTRVVPSTGELFVQAHSSLSWPIDFGTGTKPLSITNLGGSLHRQRNDGGWQAELGGTLAFDALSATVSVTLGSAGVDTIITASLGTLTATDVTRLADDLSADPDGSNRWSTLPLPDDYPELGLTGVTMQLNLTKKTFLIYGNASSFGAGAFVIQQAGTGWEAALGLNLSTPSGWSFSQISEALAPADAFFTVDHATAALAMSSTNDQLLAPIAAKVPLLAEVLPATVQRGANLYATLHFAGDVVGNVPRVLGGLETGTTVTLHALLAPDSADSLFEATLDRYTLAGAVTFSDVVLLYQPKNAATLQLQGDVAFAVGSTNLAFHGAMTVSRNAANFELTTTQAIPEPFGMSGITITDAGIAVDYLFPDSHNKTLAIVLTGGVTIGSVADLRASVFLLDGKPIIAAVDVVAFDIANLFRQSLGVTWPLDIIPLTLTSGSIYFYQPADPKDQDPITFGGRSYAPGFNAEAHLEVLGRAATVRIGIVPQHGITASGLLDAPVDLAFVQISGADTTTGPQVTLATFPETSFSVTAGVRLFDFDLGPLTLTLTKDAQADEMVGSVQISPDLPVFGRTTFTVNWSKSRGFFFTDFPIDLDGIELVLENIMAQKPGCIGKQILQALPIKTKYNFTSDYSIVDGALQIGVQGFFDLTAMNSDLLRIDLQRITVRIPPPTGGSGRFQWSNIPEWIATVLADNAGSILQQVLEDPASMAKLLAIEGVKYVAAEVVDSLVCQNPAKWGGGTAESFVDAAQSPFSQTVSVGGVGVTVGGVGVAGGGGGGGEGDGEGGGGGGGGGSVTVGGGDGSGVRPPAPGTPSNLTMNYTDDRLFLGWSSVSNATNYSYRLLTGSTLTATGTNLVGTTAVVERSSLTLGATCTLDVIALNNGVPGPAGTTSFTIPTPAGIASMLESQGVSLENAAGPVKAAFPSLQGNELAGALQGAYRANDPATWAMRMAVALRNGGMDQSRTDDAMKFVFPGISNTLLANALQAAFSLSLDQLAAHLAAEGVAFTETAAILAGAFNPPLTAAEVLPLLRAHYPNLDMPKIAIALQAAGFDAVTAGPPIQSSFSPLANDLAIALAAAYAPIDASTLAEALVAAYGSQIDDVATAQALVAAFVTPPVAPVVVAQALVAAFTNEPSARVTVALAAAFGAPHPNPIDANGIANALLGAFTIAPAEVAADLLLLVPAPSPNDVAKALVFTFIAPAIDASTVAQALRTAYGTTTPISQTDVALALVAAFTTPAPIAPNGVAVALAAAWSSPQITALELGTALIAVFGTPEPISAGAVATAMVTALTTPDPAVTALEVATALVQLFGSPAMDAQQLALALVTAFNTPALIDATLVAQTVHSALPAAEAPAIAHALVLAYSSSFPLLPAAVVTALKATFVGIDAGLMARSLVAAFPPPAITASAIAIALAGLAFTPEQVAHGLVVALPGITFAQVVVALQAAFVEPPLDACALATALVAAFLDPAITSDEVAATLKTATLPDPLTMPMLAAALVGAFVAPAIEPAAVIAAIRGVFPSPSPNDLAAALAAGYFQPPITTTALMQAVYDAFRTAPEITPDALATAVVFALQARPITASDVVTALRTVIETTTMPAAARALVAAYQPPPLTIAPDSVLIALRAAWSAAPPAYTELAQALVAAFRDPAIVADAIAAALVASAPVTPVITYDDVAIALTDALTLAPSSVAATLLATAFAVAPEPDDIAVALVAAFRTPEPIIPDALAVALQANFPTLSASGLAHALAAAFRSPAITPADAAAAVVHAFPATPANDLAIALVAAFVIIEPKLTLSAVHGAIAPPIEASTGAAALIAAYVTPQPIGAAGVAIALVSVFTMSPSEVAVTLAGALASVPLSPSDIGRALAAAWQDLGQPLNGGDVAVALQAAFTQPVPIPPSAAAAGVVAAFPGMTGGDLLTALKTAFTTPALSSTDGARALVAAITQPLPITPSQSAPELVTAFAIGGAQLLIDLREAYIGMPLGPVQAAPALVASGLATTAGTILPLLIGEWPDLSAPDVARALVGALPDIASGEVATALKGAFPGIGESGVAIALVLAFLAPQPISPEDVAATLVVAYDGISPERVAVALTAAFMTPAPLPPASVASALVTAFPATVATPERVSVALAAAFAGISANDVAAALHAAFSVEMPPRIAQALLATVTSAPSVIAQALLFAFGDAIDRAGVVSALRTALPEIAPAVAGTAVLAAYAGTTPAVLAPALVTGWSGSLEPSPLAQALTQVYGLGTGDVAALLGALSAGWNGDPGAIAADTAAMAVQTALALPLTNGELLAGPLSQQFALTRTPNDVSALAVAFYRAGYSLDATGIAFSKTFTPWTTVAFGRVLTVFARPEWDLAILLRSQGQTMSAAGAAIRLQYPLLASADLVLILASVFDCTHAETGVTPVAQAMAGAAYTLDDTSIAMSGFFIPWTGVDFGKVLAVYNAA